MDKMPLLFIGHGSPMNAIEKNEFTENWLKIAANIPKPKAILCISAHWFTAGTRMMEEAHPKMIYDMYGFPRELYEVQYPAIGAPELALYTKSLISENVTMDNTWGYDHGTWSVLHVMYPNADIPVFQLSVDRNAGAEVHFEIGKQIKSLREKGVLILGSGNVVHNLRLLDFSSAEGYGWANEFDNYIKDKIMKKEYADVVHYRKVGDSAALAVPTPDHFYPLLYVLGGLDEKDNVSIYNHSTFAGSLSMTCYLFK